MDLSHVRNLPSHVYDFYIGVMFSKVRDSYFDTYTNSNAKCLLNGFTRFLFSKYLNE